jgi:DNA processing protein
MLPSGTRCNMNDADARDLTIALSLLPFLTPNRTRLLIEYFDPVYTACNASSRLLQGLLSVTPEQAEEVRNPLINKAVTESLRDSVVTLLDDDYPPLLREIHDPPLALHYRGDLSLLKNPAIAVVGSRRATPYAVNASAHLSRQLVAAGLTVVSGLARGVDAAAHHAALDAGGNTIAVLGTGIDVIYPRSHQRLFRRMEEKGLILTEFAPGSPPKREHFPIRNRIISGLTYGTVIVEATSRSGSLITARTAAEQNREVFAVPGSIFSAGSEGTHRLIQYGAKLVHDANDVVDELPATLGLQRMQIGTEPEPESPLLDVLRTLSRDDASHVDTVATKLGRTTSAVAESLLQLELGGWIRAMGGGRYLRVK